MKPAAAPGKANKKRSPRKSTFVYLANFFVFLSIFRGKRFVFSFLTVIRFTGVFLSVSTGLESLGDSFTPTLCPG